ncbi:MAG: hypothetical protein ABWZ40_14740 [Caulobacterales bacterium]
MSFAKNLKIAGALALALAAAGCKWTSDAPLVTDDVADKSPLKPGSYSHGSDTYAIEGKGKGPIVATVHSSGDTTATTYSVKFDKLGGKVYLVQAVSGADIAYLVIQANASGFIEYRPKCDDADKAIAIAAGATTTAEDSACKFPNYDALRKAAIDASNAISRGEPGFAGDSYIRQK